jgi:hypothetical protein
MTTHALEHRRTDRQSPAWYPLISVVLAAAFVAVVAVSAQIGLRYLAAATDDLRRMDARLSTLDTMNHKLDRLASVEAGLGAMRGQLGTTVGLLRRTNTLLDETRTDLKGTGPAIRQVARTTSAMAASLRSVDAMRADIHEMSHKLDGSFLFRGVK